MARPAQTKKPTDLGWLFLFQINDLSEFYVERAMGIEHVGLGPSRKSNLWVTD
jgi:hypothetical protein